jgi:hypothetical protein
LNPLKEILSPAFIQSIADTLNSIDKSGQPNLAKFIDAANAFVGEYGRWTPAAFGLMRADLFDLSRNNKKIKEAAQNLIFTLYLAILEMKGIPNVDDDTQREIKKIAAEIVNKGPELFKAFQNEAKKQKVEDRKLSDSNKENLEEKSKRKAGVFNRFAKSGLGRFKGKPKGKESIVDLTISMLQEHGFVDEKGLDVDKLLDQGSLLIFIAQAKFDISGLIDNLAPDLKHGISDKEILDKQLGQFANLYFLLRDQGWPSTQTAVYKASFVSLIKAGMNDLIYHNDPALMENLQYAVTNKGVRTNTPGYNFKSEISEVFEGLIRTGTELTKKEFDTQKTKDIISILYVTKDMSEDLLASLKLSFNAALEEEISQAIAYFRPVHKFLEAIFVHIDSKLGKAEADDLKNLLLKTANYGYNNALPMLTGASLNKHKKHKQDFDTLSAQHLAIPPAKQQTPSSSQSTTKNPGL